MSSSEESHNLLWVHYVFFILKILYKEDSGEQSGLSIHNDSADSYNKFCNILYQNY